MAKANRGGWTQMLWHPLLMTGPQIQGTTIGFLGFGRIAQAAFQRLVAFGIERAIYVTSKTGKPACKDYFGLIEKSSIQIEAARSLDQLASESDIVVVVVVVVVGCTLTPSTRHLVNKEFFDKMKKTSVIVII